MIPLHRIEADASALAAQIAKRRALMAEQEALSTPASLALFRLVAPTFQAFVNDPSNSPHIVLSYLAERPSTRIVWTGHDPATNLPRLEKRRADDKSVVCADTMKIVGDLMFEDWRTTIGAWLKLNLDEEQGDYATKATDEIGALVTATREFIARHALPAVQP